MACICMKGQYLDPVMRDMEAFLANSQDKCQEKFCRSGIKTLSFFNQWDSISIMI